VINKLEEKKCKQALFVGIMMKLKFVVSDF
jgi:hypothetical protein